MTELSPTAGRATLWSVETAETSEPETTEDLPRSDRATSPAIEGSACSSRVDWCDAIENGYSTRLEGDAFDVPACRPPPAGRPCRGPSPASTSGTAGRPANTSAVSRRALCAMGVAPAVEGR